MSVTGIRHVVNLVSGDFAASDYAEAAENASSPAKFDIISLASGNNTITPPTGAVGFTLLPPAGNVNVLTLKGVNGDTGIALHKTDPTSLGLNSTTGFVLSCTTTTSGVRLIWV